MATVNYEPCRLERLYELRQTFAKYTSKLTWTCERINRREIKRSFLFELTGKEKKEAMLESALKMVREIWRKVKKCTKTE